MIFVNTVVTQVDTRIIQTALICRVFHCSEADNTMTIEVNNKRVVRRNSNVKTQVALKINSQVKFNGWKKIYQNFKNITLWPSTNKGLAIYLDTSTGSSIGTSSG
jgi:hypothetical protein